MIYLIKGLANAKIQDACLRFSSLVAYKTYEDYFGRVVCPEINTRYLDQETSILPTDPH